MLTHATAQKNDSQANPLRSRYIADLTYQSFFGEKGRSAPDTGKTRIHQFFDDSTTSSLISIEKIPNLVDRISCGSDINQLRFQTSPVSLDSQEAFRPAENQQVAIDVSNKERRLPMTTGIFHGIHTQTPQFSDGCRPSAKALVVLYRYRSPRPAGATTRFAQNIGSIAGSVKPAETGTAPNPLCELQKYKLPARNNPQT
jgi:hypothetical protein